MKYSHSSIDHKRKKKSGPVGIVSIIVGSLIGGTLFSSLASSPEHEYCYYEMDGDLECSDDDGHSSSGSYYGYKSNNSDYKSSFRRSSSSSFFGGK